MSCLIAIDPGLTGGIAIFEDGKLLNAYSMPIWKTRLSSGGALKRQVDVLELKKTVMALGITTMVTEYQTPMPGQSSVATATSFLNWGLVLSLRSLCAIHVIHPRVWKNHFRLDKNKKAAIDLAIGLFPGLGKSARDGVAEACLIGHYWITTGAANERSHGERRQRRDEKRALAKAHAKGRRGKRNPKDRAAAAKPAGPPAA